MTVRAGDDRLVHEFVEACGESGPVAVEGGRTRWARGGDLVEGTRTLVAPAGIMDYQPEEMTVRVRAGTLVADLHAELAERGQRSALPERGGTVGGAIAVGENHLCMSGRGRLRASVLQVGYVSAEGRLVTGGGPTVKNVSGYDLPRLMVGSLGTLGLVSDVILRVNPLPAASLWLSADDADVDGVRAAVLRPGAILWNGSTTWVLLEGHRPDVDSSAAQLGRCGSFVETDGPPDLPAHRWSVSPSVASAPDREATGGFVAEVCSGLLFAENAAPVRGLDPGVAAIHARMKSNFDPTGRLNPGRDPGAT